MWITQDLIDININVFRIAENSIAIFKGKFFSFDHEMDAISLGHGCEFETISYSKLFHQDHSLAGRRLAMDVEIAIRHSQWRKNSGSVRS